MYGEVDVEILPPERYREVRRGAGAESSLKRAAEILAEAKLPVIISGQGVVLADGVEEPFRRDALKKPTRHLPRYQQ